MLGQAFLHSELRESVEGTLIAVNGNHPCKSLSCQLNNRLLSVQLFSFHTVIVHVGGEKSGRNDLTKAECSRWHRLLQSLQPQSSRNNTFVTALKARGDLMPVATVCHCDATGQELTALSCPPGL